MVELLANREEECSDELYGVLPDEVREDLEELSPLAGEEIASGPRDKHFPISESHALASIAPDLRVTVAGALDHAELGFSFQDIPAFFRMDGFAVRSLREARGV